MDRKTVVGVASNVIGNGLIVPTLLAVCKVTPLVIVSASVVLMTGFALWGHTPDLGWRRRVMPVVVMALGIIVFSGGAVAFYLQKPAVQSPKGAEGNGEKVKQVSPNVVDSLSGRKYAQGQPPTLYTHDEKPAEVSELPERPMIVNPPQQQRPSAPPPPSIHVEDSPGSIIAPSGGTNTIYNGPPREPDGLYQGQRQVGSVFDPEIDEASGTVTFRAMQYEKYPDKTKPLDFRDYEISCAYMPVATPGVYAGRLSIMINGPVTCKIVKKK